MDKIFPIDSIYTIGTFNELIERIVMPTLIMNMEKDKNTIQLEAWPFCIDMISDIENKFAGRLASQWLYNMYDNNFRIFIHLNEEIMEDEESLGEDADQANLYPNVAIELRICPTDFDAFFERVGNCPSGEAYDKFKESYEASQSGEDRLEQMAAFKREIRSVVSHLPSSYAPKSNTRYPRLSNKMRYWRTSTTRGKKSNWRTEISSPTLWLSCLEACMPCTKKWRSRSSATNFTRLLDFARSGRS